MPTLMDFSDLAGELARVGRRLDDRGWVLGTSGNFSVVLGHTPLRLAITRAGPRRDSSTAGRDPGDRRKRRRREQSAGQGRQPRRACMSRSCASAGPVRCFTRIRCGAPSFPIGTRLREGWRSRATRCSRVSKASRPTSTVSGFRSSRTTRTWSGSAGEVRKNADGSARLPRLSPPAPRVVHLGRDASSGHPPRRDRGVPPRGGRKDRTKETPWRSSRYPLRTAAITETGAVLRFSPLEASITSDGRRNIP